MLPFLSCAMLRIIRTAGVAAVTGIAQAVKRGRSSMKKTICYIITGCMFAGTFQAVSSEAKSTPKLSTEQVFLEKGNTKTVTMKGLSKKQTVKWTTGNSKIFSVNKKGKIKAKKAGEAKLTAKVGKKKYKCKVVVFPKIKMTFNNDVFTEERYEALKKIELTGYYKVSDPVLLKMVYSKYASTSLRLRTEEEIKYDEESPNKIGLSYGPKFYFGKNPSPLSVTLLVRSHVIVGDEVYINEGDDNLREANQLIEKYGIIIPLEGRYE